MISNKWLALLICLLIVINAQSQKNLKVINIDDKPFPLNFSVGTILGGGRGFSPVNSGFDADDGTIAVFYPGGGIFVGVDGYITYEKLISFGMAYKYQVGSLNLFYDNSESYNTKNVVTPMLKIRSFSSKKGQAFLGLGLEMILSNNFEISAEHTNFKEIALYKFKTSNGPVIMFEYQQKLNRWVGGKFGLKSGYLKYEMTDASLRHEPISLKSAKKPQDILKYSSGFVEFFIGIYFQKK